MNELTKTLDEFLADLKRGEDLLGLIKAFREFGSSSVPGEILNGSVIWDEAMVLKDVAPTLRTDLPLLSGSMLLYICGRFEYFVRQIVEAVGDEIAARATVYDELPQKLRNELRRGTLDIALNHNKYNMNAAEADALVADLVSSSNGGGGAGSIRIASRVLSVTDSNMNANTLGDLMKRIGMAEMWRDAGKQAKLKMYFSIGGDGECTSEAMGVLTKVMKDRNQIAHPTSGTTFPDPDQVLRTTGYMAALGTVLVELCQVHLASFNSGKP